MTRDASYGASGAPAFGRRKGGPKPPPRKSAGPAPIKRPPSRRRRIVNGVIAFLVVAILVGAGGTAFWLFHDLPALPDEKALWAMSREPGIIFEDVNGQVLATRGAHNGYRVHLEDLPPYVSKAFLAAEDRRFYDHGPVELRSILRALFRNIHADGPDQGASTLTQQIVKTIMLSPERTLKRKAQEAVLAWRLERRLGKDKVLELYLNRIYFGARSYGLDAASQQYFGHPAQTLTLSEATLLAALPKAPSRLAPNRNFPDAEKRAHLILSIMREEGWITEADEKMAVSSPPNLSDPAGGDGDFGYVLDLAAAEATDIVGQNAPDLIVRLTIDPDLQRKAQAIVTQTIARQGRADRVSQASLIAMTPDGAIRAVVGGVSHAQSPFNRATQAFRQPGSSFKPIVFAAALERGVTPQDIVVDKPVRIGNWTPANYGGGYAGQMTVERALENSVNTVAVRLAYQVGREKLGEISRRFGLTTIPDSPSLSVSLGAYEVSLRELTNAFQVFQNGGERRPSYLVSSVATSSGETLYTHPGGAGLPAYDTLRAGAMVHMMEGVILSGTGRRADFGRPAAGKTGTSQDWRDAWFVGFTPDWAAGVWVGNDDNTPMNHITGGSLPAEIWRKFMIEAHKGVPVHDFDFIPDLPPQPQPDPFDNAEELEYARVGEDEQPTVPGPAPAAPAVAARPQNPGAFYSSLAGAFADPDAR